MTRLNELRRLALVRGVIISARKDERALAAVVRVVAGGVVVDEADGEREAGVSHRFRDHDRRLPCRLTVGDPHGRACLHAA